MTSPVWHCFFLYTWTPFLFPAWIIPIWTTSSHWICLTSSWPHDKSHTSSYHSFQTVSPYPILSFTKIKSILLFQFLADFDIPITVVLVIDDASVVIHSVENNVNMRMLLVIVPGNDILGIFDSHFLHILLCQTYQHLIRHSRSVLRCIAERDMSHRLTNIRFHHPLSLKTVRNSLNAVRQHSFRNQ